MRGGGEAGKERKRRMQVERMAAGRRYTYLPIYLGLCLYTHTRGPRGRSRQLACIYLNLHLHLHLHRYLHQYPYQYIYASMPMSIHTYQGSSRSITTTFQSASPSSIIHRMPSTFTGRTLPCLVNHISIISQPYQYSWSISVVSYTECPLYSKRTHSIVREHILWRLLKEYQYTTHSLSWCDTSNTLYNTL